MSVSVRARTAPSPFGRSATMDKLPVASTPTTSYGLAAASQLGGAVAKVIRDPSADEPEIVVLADEQLTHVSYLNARYVLTLDKRAVPSLTSRRVWTIMPDGLIKLETAGQTQWRKLNLVYGNLQETAVPNMRRREPNARVIDVDGIGKVRLVFDRQNPHG